MTFIILVAYIIGTVAGFVWWCISWVYKGFFWKIYGPATADIKVVETAYWRNRTGAWNTASASDKE